MKIILMSGIPGSGKSTYVDKLRQDNFDKAVNVCSADHYFMVDGEYKFNPANLGKAHAACLYEFTTLLTAGHTYHKIGESMLLVVDNTNTSAIELAPYVALAAAFKVDCEIVTVLCDPTKAAMRNVHGVLEHAVKRMDEAIRNRQLPPFWNVTHTVIPTWNED